MDRRMENKISCLSSRREWERRETREKEREERSEKEQVLIHTFVPVLPTGVDVRPWWQGRERKKEDEGERERERRNKMCA